MDPQGAAPKARDLVRRQAATVARLQVVAKAVGDNRRPQAAAKAAKAAEASRAARTGSGERTTHLHASFKMLRPQPAQRTALMTLPTIGS